MISGLYADPFRSGLLHLRRGMGGHSSPVCFHELCFGLRKFMASKEGDGLSKYANKRLVVFDAGMKHMCGS